MLPRKRNKIPKTPTAILCSKSVPCKEDRGIVFPQTCRKQMPGATTRKRTHPLKGRFVSSAGWYNQKEISS